MIPITSTIVLDDGEVELSAIRSQGAGGQHVNKVSTAIQLRFDIRASSLPEPVRERLLASNDRRISGDGVLVIKAQRHRSQELNRRDALDKLREIVAAASVVRAPRRATTPTRASMFRRLESKARRAQVKGLRRPVSGGD
ncbi:MAG: alternative ribosome rescue aminoacyl-tRNA hydrolase ArfB [Burkholderiaceae bacterium]